MATAPCRALSAALEMARMTASNAFWSMALTTVESGATDINFIVRLTTLCLLDIRLRFDREFFIRNV